MASLKEVKARIASVNSTLKITSAMKMVASAKLHRAQAAIESRVAAAAAMASARLALDMMDMIGFSSLISRTAGRCCCCCIIAQPPTRQNNMY